MEKEDEMFRRIFFKKTYLKEKYWLVPACIEGIASLCWAIGWTDIFIVVMHLLSNAERPGGTLTELNIALLILAFCAAMRYLAHILDSESLTKILPANK